MSSEVENRGFDTSAPLVSGVEEHRIPNKELEITKAELQKAVEDLTVSNQELAFRIHELNYLRTYSEAIVSTITQPLVVVDNELKVKSANSAFYENLFLTRQQTEGKYFYEINNRQWDIPELRITLEHSLKESTFFENLEMMVKSPALGDRIMVLNVKRIFREGSTEQLVLITFDDVTDHRTTEESLKEKAEFLRGILESTPQMSSTALPDGTTNYYNNYFLNYTGLSYDQAIEAGWQKIMHPDDYERSSKSWIHSVSTGEEFEQEMRLKRHDGIYRWHISRALPTWNSDGKITSWVGTATDVHEQKMFSQELERKVRRRTRSLKESNIALEHSNRNLEQFAFIASHDLQEPLRKILTFSGMLTDNFRKELPASAATLVAKISASSNRMSSLIHDVLNFSRIDKQANAFETIDLNTVLSNVLGDFSLLIEEKRASIQVGNLPFAAVVPFQINQLFYNLVSNSLKFTRTDGHPEINITCRALSAFQVAKFPRLNKDHSYLEILFEDNGIGFEQEYSEKIFEIFQRLHSSAAYPGTGIGLALCKKIVTHHNGEILAESRDGGGALFRIILPLEHHGAVEKILPGYKE